MKEVTTGKKKQRQQGKKSSKKSNIKKIFFSWQTPTLLILAQLPKQLQSVTAHARLAPVIFELIQDTQTDVFLQML